jgi:hypothetical protein
LSPSPAQATCAALARVVREWGGARTLAVRQHFPITLVGGCAIVERLTVCAMAAHFIDEGMRPEGATPTPTSPSPEATRTPAAGQMNAFGDQVVPWRSHVAGGGASLELMPSSEAARAPMAGVTASWLNPGFPDSTVCLMPEGTVSYNNGTPHGFVACVADGQLLLFFHHRGEERLAVPHLLRPMVLEAAPLTWRTHDCKEVLVLPAPLPDKFVPLLASDTRRRGVWFVPGREPSLAEFAPGGSAILNGSAASWGFTYSSAGGAARAPVLVLVLRTPRGDEPVVLRELAPGIWRCTAQRCVLVEDGAPRPRIEPADLPRFVPKERLRYSFLWLHPGRAPQTVNLTTDGKVAWSVMGGLVSGPTNGSWQYRCEGAQESFALNFHAFGDESKLRSTVLERIPFDLHAYRAVGSMTPSGVLQAPEPHELADWHVVALVAQLPRKRPGVSAVLQRACTDAE